MHHSLQYKNEHQSASKKNPILILFLLVAVAVLVAYFVEVHAKLSQKDEQIKTLTSLIEYKNKELTTLERELTQLKNISRGMQEFSSP